MRRKHIPQRTCIGCRQVRAKRDMIRIVRTPEKKLVIDQRGKQNGRGAYLCPTRACWQAALKGGRIGRALNMDIGALEREILENFMNNLTG